MRQPERRKSPRFVTELPAQLSAAEALSCRVLNLSRTGALAVTPKPLPELSQVRIRLDVHDGVPEKDLSLACEAAVVRCDRRPDGRYDIGLFFTSLKDADRSKLEEILKRKALQPSS